MDNIQFVVIKLENGGWGIKRRDLAGNSLGMVPETFETEGNAQRWIDSFYAQPAGNVAATPGEPSAGAEPSDIVPDAASESLPVPSADELNTNGGEA